MDRKHLLAIFAPVSQHRIIYRLSVFALVVLVLSSLYLPMMGRIETLHWIVWPGSLVTFLSSAIIARAGKSIEIAGILLIAGCMSITLVTAYYDDGIFSSFCVWFLVITLIGGSVVGARIACVAGILGAFSLAALAYLSRLAPLAVGGPANVLMPVLNLILGVVFCSFVAVYLNRLLGQMQRTLMKQQLDAQNSQALVQANMSMTADAVLVINSAGKIELFNQAAEQFYGISEEQAVGSVMHELIIPERLRPDHENGFQRYLDTGIPNVLGIRLETYSQNKDGLEFPVELIVQTVVRDEQVKFIAQIKDLTERNKLRSELEIRKEQIGLDHRLQTLGKLSGAVAHDFNNLLMVIQGYAEFLLERNELTVEAEQDLKEIIHAGEQATEITKQLLEFSRKDRPAAEHISPTAMIEGLVGMFGRIFPSAINLYLDIDKASWLVHTEGARLEQAVLNLFLNAADAMPEGGTIWVRVQDVTVDVEKANSIEGLKVGDYACIEIEDSGIGMDHEVMAHIFDPFYTTKAMGEGTGLGLATTQSIVNQSGGSIHVQSAKDKGSKFSIYLPRASEVEKYYSIPDKAAAQNPGLSRTILVVEDDPAVRRVLTRALVADNFQVLEASNGEEGYEIALKHALQIDLVITDVVMPKLGGPEMVRRLVVSFPSVKVIYLSGYVDGGLEASDLDNDRIEFLAKPYSYTDLKEIISRLMLIN